MEKMVATPETETREEEGDILVDTVRTNGNRGTKEGWRLRGRLTAGRG